MKKKMMILITVAMMIVLLAAGTAHAGTTQASQSFEQQQAKSGHVSQSFNVSNTGDNSNQCAGIQGVANTGNAQNQIGLLQYGSLAHDDFYDFLSFKDSGSSISVSPTNVTSCNQQVNQAASAFGS